MKVDEEQGETGRQGYTMKALQNFIGHGPVGWVPTQLRGGGLAAAKGGAGLSSWGTGTGTTWTKRNVCNE